MEKYLLTSKIEGEGGESRQGGREDGCGRRDGGREREGVNRRFSLFLFFLHFSDLLFFFVFLRFSSLFFFKKNKEKRKIKSLFLCVQ